MDAIEHSLRFLESVHHYNRWIFDTISGFLGQNILEIGCGTGNITQYLLGCGAVTSMDIDPAFARYTRERLGADQNLRVYVMDVLAPDPGVIPRESFDTVVCLNVLEHIDDDERALASIREFLAPGGKVVILAPALPALYGSLDRALGHARRYSRAELLGKVRRQGWKPRVLRYFNLLGTVGWLVSARLLKREYLPVRQTRLFDRLVPYVRGLEDIVEPPLGQSILLVAEKPAGHAAE